MQAVLDDPAERDVRIFKIPLSGIRQNGQKINYYDFLYGNMKTVHACFQTGVTRHEKEPTFKSNMLFYDGWYDTIGEEYKEFIADKMNDPDFLILTLAGIASELAFYGRLSADVHLARGLPLTWVAEQKDDFKKYLMGNTSL